MKPPASLTWRDDALSIYETRGCCTCDMVQHKGYVRDRGGIKKLPADACDVLGMRKERGEGRVECMCISIARQGNRRVSRRVRERDVT